MKYLKKYNENITDFHWDFHEEEVETTDIFGKGSEVSSKGISVYDEMKYLILMEDNWITESNQVLILNGKKIRPLYITTHDSEVSVYVKRSTLEGGYSKRKTLIVLGKNDWDKVEEGDVLYIYRHYHYNENVDFDWTEEDFEYEEGVEDFVPVPLDHKLKKGDRVKLRELSRYKNQSGNRKGTIVNRYNYNNPNSWWNIQWDFKDGYTNKANYPIEDILISYEDIKQNENFEFGDEDFDFEEEEPRGDVDRYIEEFLHPDKIINQIGNVRIKMTLDKWDIFVDSVRKYSKNIKWVTGMILDYGNFDDIRKDFPQDHIGDVIYMFKTDGVNDVLYFRPDEDDYPKGVKTYEL